MTSLQERLFAMQDKQYAAFQAKLTPGVPMESFIGIRVPVLRKFAKEFTKEAECKEFLHQLPHEYYDENMLHGLLISEVKDYEECIRLTDSFLPFVDNWAVCDIMSPKVFAKHKEELLAKIKTWSKSSHVYTCRFGIDALMSHYLDKDFKAEYLEIPASVRSEEYYVKMMVAWFFATALAKQWNQTIPYIEQHRLAPWTHNKTETSLTLDHRGYYMQISFSPLHPLLVVCLAKAIRNPDGARKQQLANELNLHSVLGSHAINEDVGCYSYRATHWLDTELTPERFFEILSRCVDEADRGYFNLAG